MITELSSKIFMAAAAGVVVFGFAAGPAEASRSGYCDAYARDVANSRTGAGDVLTGTVGGALGGALIGGIIDKGEGAGKGAIIGGVAGTVLGAAGADAKWKKAYRRAYDNCMARYDRTDAVYSGDGRPAPGTKAWYRYCAAKYRSFNPDTGRYTAYSGKTYPCR